MPKLQHGLEDDFRGPIARKPANHDDIEGRRALKSCLAKPSLRVGNECRAEVEFPDLRVKPDLTGRWVDKRGRFNLFLNQAGPHLEGLLALVRNGFKPKVVESDSGAHVDERPTKLCFRLFADHLDRRTWLLGVRDEKEEENAIGQIEIVSTSPPRIRFRLDEGRIKEITALDEAEMIQLHARPSLFERYVAQKSVPPSVRTSLWFPLTPQQEALLSRHIVRHKSKVKQGGVTRELTLEQMMRAFFDLEKTEKGPRLEGLQNTAAQQIDKHVQEVFGSAQSLPVESGGIHQCQQGLHETIALQALASNTMFFGGGRQPLLDVLRVVLERARRKDQIQQIPARLGLDPRAQEEYVAELEFESKTRKFSRLVHAGFAEGRLTLSRVTPPFWTGKFDLRLTTAQLKLQAGKFKFKAPGKTRFAGSWLPEQIPGRCLFNMFSTAKEPGPKRDDAPSKLEGIAILSLVGNGPGRPTASLSLEFDVSESGAHAGDLTCVGEAVADGKPFKLPEFSPGKAAQRLYTFPLALDNQHFYATNNANLTPHDQARLARFVATELAAFTDEGILVAIVGHADRPDKAANNKRLSEHRAATVTNFVGALLDNPLPEGTAVGRGEEEAEAAEAGSPVKPNMKFRRVDIYVAGMLLFSTRAARR